MYLMCTRLRRCLTTTEHSARLTSKCGEGRHVSNVYMLTQVLDDNRTLCLPNGERIKLNGKTLRMLFEVEDCSVASPATVSRLGVVWIPPEALGMSLQLDMLLPVCLYACVLEDFSVASSVIASFLSRHYVDHSHDSCSVFPRLCLLLQWMSARTHALLETAYQATGQLGPS